MAGFGQRPGEETVARCRRKSERSIDETKDRKKKTQAMSTRGTIKGRGAATKLRDARLKARNFCQMF
jgi:hypothetical protein